MELAPFADRYAHWLESGRVREEAASLQVAREIPDFELQTRWFAGEFGTEFVTVSGDPVAIVDFGRWNRDDGPRFKGARVSFRGERPLQGGIEVNGKAGEWADHAGTLLRVFAGGGVGGFGNARIRTPAGEERDVPQVALDVTRLEFGSDEPAPGAATACHAPLASFSGSQAVEFLETAARYRLCRKAARLRRLFDRFGPDEGLYQGLAETLGYRANKLPFRLITQRFPLAFLRSRPDEIETLLFAGSGFLTATDLGAMPGDTRGYLRDLWSRWWPHRSEFERLVLPAELWNIKGVRPANHPQRRVAALASLVRNWAAIQSLATVCEVRSIRTFFAGLRHEYWDAHYTLTSRRSPKRMALVGETRVAEMLANVFFPLAITANPRLWETYRKLPAGDSSRKVELAADRLFGERPLPRRLLKLAVIQQGLLQLYDDHCRECGADCNRCLLPERVERW